MHFSKSKSRGGPLHRLSEQRRRLALAGLAVGSVFSAAIFRRKRGGEEVQFESSARFDGLAAAMPPEPETLVAQPESGPPPTVDAPVPASEPELEEVPRPINAAPASEGAVASPPAPVPASAPASFEPITGELSLEEASIISILAQSGRADEDRTASVIADSLGRDAGAVTSVLRKLGDEGVVSVAPASSGEEIWAVTERGVRRLGAQI